MNWVHVAVEDVGVLNGVHGVDHKSYWLVFVDLIGNRVDQVGRVVHVVVNLTWTSVRFGTLDVKFVCRVIHKHFKLDRFGEARVGAVSTRR